MGTPGAYVGNLADGEFWCVLRYLLSRALNEKITVNSISDILAPYHRSLNMHIEIVNSLRSHSVSFDESREFLSRWITQPWLEEDGWEAKWEDLCEIEVGRWDGV